MAGIIEIWRKDRDALQPIRFVVGNAPMMADSAPAPEAPAVKSIVYRELQTLGNGRYHEPLFCISFEDTDVQRLIPASEVTEIAYEPKKAEPETKTPALES